MRSYSSDMETPVVKIDRFRNGKTEELTPNSVVINDGMAVCIWSDHARKVPLERVVEIIEEIGHAE